MNPLGLTLCLFASSATLLCAQTSPRDIAKEYEEKAATALDGINQAFEEQGTELAAKLVAAGDIDGAYELSKQIKSKVAGLPVQRPHFAAITFFRQYDAARVAALKPVQESCNLKIEAMLKTPAGKNMESVLEFGKIRRDIESGFLIATLPFPEVWTYHISENGAAAADATFAADGSFDLYDYRYRTSMTGTWTRTAESNIVLVRYKNMEWKVVSQGDKAVIERPDVGIRYLRLKKTKYNAPQKAQGAGRP